MDNWQVYQGSALTINATLKDSLGNPIAYAGTETLNAEIWPGGNLGATPLDVEWVNAAGGLTLVTLTRAQSALIAAGVYDLRETIVISGQTFDAYLATVTVIASSGAANPLPVYGTFDDLSAYGGGDWLDTIRRASAQTNFARERNSARMWLDGLIVKKFRPWAGSNAAFGAYLLGPRDARNPVLRDYLAADYTVGVVLPNGVTLTPPATVLMQTDAIREIVATKTLELVCRNRVTLEDADVMVRRANYFRAVCRRKVLTSVAELDIDQDGLADYAFNLGVASIR